MNALRHTLPAAVRGTPLRAAQWLLRTRRQVLPGVTVRVAQPSDIGPLQQLYASLSTQTRAQRFFTPLRELPRDMLNTWRMAATVGWRQPEGGSGLSQALRSKWLARCPSHASPSCPSSRS